jgi:hypothetical protein
MTEHISPDPLAAREPWSVYVGDARMVLGSMPERSADCIVTSPPYWGKRDYGVTGQYGHEDTPAAYVETMQDVFHEARRVLADDGTCWLNLGDSYSASAGGATGKHAYLGEHITTHRTAGMHAKNLLGLPWQVAFALQADGWILRNAIVWHKPNAMPESVRDRLNCRHELLFLLTKSPAYWFDLDPIREPHKTVHPREAGTARGRTRPPGRPGSRTRPPKYGPGTPEVTASSRYGGRRHTSGHPNGRNPDDVWSVATVQGAALCRLPDRAAAALHRRRVQARRGRPRPVHRQRHHGTRRDPARPPVYRHRPVARLRRTGSRTSRPGRRRQDGGRAMNLNHPAEITTRNDIARDIIAGFAAVTPHLTGICYVHDSDRADHGVRA